MFSPSGNRLTVARKDLISIILLTRASDNRLKLATSSLSPSTRLPLHHFRDLVIEMWMISWRSPPDPA